MTDEEKQGIIRVRAAVAALYVPGAVKFPNPPVPEIDIYDPEVWRIMQHRKKGKPS